MWMKLFLLVVILGPCLTAWGCVADVPALVDLGLGLALTAYVFGPPEEMEPREFP